MEDKIKVWKLKSPSLDGKWCIFFSIEDVLATLEIDMKEYMEETGSDYDIVITPMLLTQEEIDNLPEFEA